MQRYFSNEKKDNYLILNEDDIHHITHVMRMKESDNIQIVYNKKLYLCCIENVNEKIRFRIEKELEYYESLAPKIRLIIPLLKEQKLDLILQKSTELGVDEIVLAPFIRSIIRLDSKKEISKIERWKKIVKEASEQSMRIDMPTIRLISKFNEIENFDGVGIICSTTEKENNIKKYVQIHKKCDRINLVIGPEGGIDPKEEDYLESIGYKKATLGNQILRVETVPIYLLSIINYEFME